MKRFALVVMLAIAGVGAAAQQFDLSIDNIMRGPGLVGPELRRLHRRVRLLPDLS